MSYKWVTVKGDGGERSYKVSEGSGKFWVYDGSGHSVGTARSMEDALTLIRSSYGKRVWSTDVGEEHSGGCFPAGSPVLTPGGRRPIELLQRGDLVLSYRTGRSEVTVEMVTRRIDHGLSMLWEVGFAVRRKSLFATAVHCMLTRRGWVRVADLQVGDELVRTDGVKSSPACVKSVAESGCWATVHNLHTTGEHNFVVDGLVAHNFSYFSAPRMLYHRIFVDPFSRASIRRYGSGHPVSHGS